MKKHYLKFCSLFLMFCSSMIAGAQNEVVKNPLSQVAKFNINKDGTFAAGNENTAVGDYFSWYDAQEATTPKGYHVPSRDEAMVIFGEMAAWKENKPPFPIFTTPHELPGEETVCIWGETADYKAVYKGFADHKAYAIRFIGGDNKYLSAYCWEALLTGEQVPDDYGPIDCMDGVKVTCRLLGAAGADIDISEVADEKFWETNNENDVTRYIVAGGFLFEGQAENVYARGRYWTTSEWANPQSSNSGYGFGCDSDWAYVTGWERNSEFNIRVFQDVNTDPEPGDDTPVDHELNPLNMVADFNLNSDGTFTSGDAKEATGDYFTWEQAQTALTPEGYHIPSKDEAMVLFGEMNQDLGKDQPPYVEFDSEINYSAQETVSIWGEEGTYTCYFRAYANDICYALRFIGGDNKYVSAFRWELLPSGGTVDEMFGPIRKIYGVKATCRLLGPAGKDIEVNKIANEEYWNSENENDVTKYFPASGFSSEGDGVLESVGVRGRFWTTSKRINEEAGNFSGYGFGFDEFWAFAYPWNPSAAFSLRCVKNNPFVTDGIKDLQNEDTNVAFTFNGMSKLYANSELSNINIFNITGSKVFDSNETTNCYNVALKKGVYLIQYTKANDHKTGIIKFAVR